MNMNKIFTLAIGVLMSMAVFSGCATQSQLAITPGTAHRFPRINQNGKVAIVAHRGYWNCEEAGYQENSIASLRMAQEIGCWGSELDVQLTSDDVVLVNHDNNIQKVSIWNNPYKVFAKMTLKNGEHPSTLDEYLEQGKKCSTTMLVIELKKQRNNDREDVLWAKTVESLKAHGMYDPNRVIFISFSKHLCKRVADDAPQFVNQYLNGDLSPKDVSRSKINGIDYQDSKIKPEWIKEAHDLGMSVNVWTVNKASKMRKFADDGVDAITTNEPLEARKVLGRGEFKLTK